MIIRQWFTYKDKKNEDHVKMALIVMRNTDDDYQIDVKEKWNTTKMSIRIELTCDGLVSHPRRVKDSHPLNTWETEDKRGLHWAYGS